MASDVASKIQTALGVTTRDAPVCRTAMSSQMATALKQELEKAGPIPAKAALPKQAQKDWQRGWTFEFQTQSSLWSVEIRNEEAFITNTARNSVHRIPTGDADFVRKMAKTIECDPERLWRMVNGLCQTLHADALEEFNKSGPIAKELENPSPASQPKIHMKAIFGDPQDLFNLNISWEKINGFTVGKNDMRIEETDVSETFVKYSLSAGIHSNGNVISLPEQSYLDWNIKRTAGQPA